MRPFTYVRAADEASALEHGRGQLSGYIAGGTSLLDLMKLGVERRSTLVDINPLPLARIEERADGLVLGAMARNSDVAHHASVATRYPALAEALLSGASPQLRNMATVGGNLLQRTRCAYFRDPSVPCNKKTPGAGCPAWDGYNRMHAVLGGSERCIAANPSDMCVALIALDAVIHTRGPDGPRAIAMKDFHVAPGDRPDVETVLRPGELVTHVHLPATAFAARSRYVKLRDRASYAFALASAAVALDVRGGTIRAARVALGGVATKPWRCFEAEEALVGKPPTAAVFTAAGVAAVRGAAPRKHNAFKVELAKRAVVRALSTVGGAA